MICYDDHAAFLSLERKLSFLESRQHSHWLPGPFTGSLDPNPPTPPEGMAFNPLYWDNIGRPALEWLSDEVVLGAEPYLPVAKLAKILRRGARR